LFFTNQDKDHSLNIFVAIFIKEINNHSVIMEDDIIVSKHSDDTLKPVSVVYHIAKTCFDYVFSLLILILLSPFLLLLSVIILFSGKGPVIYTQDRIGKDGKPFSIYKFRSMVFDAEKGQPFLSVNGDERITLAGRFLRKYRIDEIPNFLNVLKGEMSIVGPRPERDFFICRIVEKAPQYIELHRVKPGITSWGQVKYGYASSVEEMIERLDYDIYYLRHRSLLFDMKIICFTIGAILKGKGR